MFDAGLARQAIIATLPAQTSTDGGVPETQYFYLPKNHLKLLENQTHIVLGARGVGKTIWAAMLTDDSAIDALSPLFPELRGVKGLWGHSERARPDAYPTAGIFRKLLADGHDPADIWRAVVARALAADAGVTVPTGTWSESVRWAEQEPEQYARLVDTADTRFVATKTARLLVFDALDRCAADWDAMDRLLKGLLQVMLELKPQAAIRTKVFLRVDQMNPSVTAFPDASKLTATQIELTWPAHDLHALLWQYLLNGPGVHGEFMRNGYEMVTGAAPRKRRDVYEMRLGDRGADANQKKLFEALAGPWMGRNHRRGVPFTWIIGHLADGQRHTSPRSFLAAIRSAAEDSQDRYRDHPHALHYESIRRGVQGASQIRVQEVTEDFPWVRTALEPLKGCNVPCLLADIQSRWESAFPKGLPNEAPESEDDVRLPPAGDTGWRGIAASLKRIGIFELMSDDRINMPDLYRVGFGLGRRGGVQPVGKK